MRHATQTDELRNELCESLKKRFEGQKITCEKAKNMITEQITKHVSDNFCIVSPSINVEIDGENISIWLKDETEKEIKEIK